MNGILNEIQDHSSHKLASDTSSVNVHQSDSDHLTNQFDADQLQALIIEKKLKSLEPTRIFSSEPVASFPCTVCFDYLGASMSHADVIASVRAALNRNSLADNISHHALLGRLLLNQYAL